MDRRWLIFGCVFLFVVCLGTAMILAARSWIGGEGVAREAAQRHPEAEDAVAALMAVVADENIDPRERTQAVWALGQMREPRALPLLESLYTGEPCDHDLRICQYELGKAILKIKGEYVGGWQVPHANSAAPSSNGP